MHEEMYNTEGDFEMRNPNLYVYETLQQEGLWWPDRNPWGENTPWTFLEGIGNPN